MSRRAVALLLLAVTLHRTAAQVGPACASGGVNLITLNADQGTKIPTPFGELAMNPCTPIQDLCPVVVVAGSPAVQSQCCFKSNQTSNADWESCGSAFRFTKDLDERPMTIGIVTSGGKPDYCGGKLAPPLSLQSSVAFACDATATGLGRLEPAVPFLQPPYVLLLALLLVLMVLLL